MTHPIRTETPKQSHRVLAVVRHPVGGVRTHILYTYPILMQAGYRFTFVIPDHESSATFKADVASWDEVEMVTVPLSQGGGGSPKFWPALRKLLRQRRFSLIHSHGIQAAVPSLFANLGTGVPHVMTSQDVFCHVEFPGVMGRLKLRVLEHLLRRLDVLIAVSEDTRDDHLQYLPGLRRGPCRAVVIPNGIDLKKFAQRNSEASGSLRREIGIGDDVFLIGFLGRFMPQKGFMVLVDALSAIARQPLPQLFHLLAVGSGDCLVNYRAELDRYPRVSRCITFMDQVPDVTPILGEIDLLAMPSLWEACPILPMEAMVLGVPIVATNCVGLREVLEGTPSVMVPPADTDALASALDRAIRSPWTEAARRYAPEARRRFDVGPKAVRLRELFDEITD